MIISIAIQKGGSGKTTTAINVAAALRELGKNVLIVDMDPQSNLSQALGLTNHEDKNIYSLISKSASGNDVNVMEAIDSCCGLSIIPASLELANAEMELVSTYGREKILDELLQPIKDSFDFIIIDCPPAIGMLTVNALTASNFAIIPMQAEYLPMQGVKSFMQTFQKVKKHLNKSLEVLGFVITKYEKHKTMNREMLNNLAEEYGNLVFNTHIRTNIDLAKSQQAGTDIFTYKKSTNGAIDYMALAKEILEKTNN